MESTTTNAIAPFIMKTYEMVNDPTTDGLICWGRANNSFVVADPLDFSRQILPSYFKHNNFSSFVRQLNTYGFRKVDPDKWEFASEWFLKGQKHLLRKIARRKQSNSNRSMSCSSSSTNSSSEHKSVEELCNEEMVLEIARLKDEQRALDKEIEGMRKRLETTENRPHQMMAFLYNLVDDPDILPRMMLRNNLRTAAAKKRRLDILPPPDTATTSSTTSGKTDDEDDVRTTAGLSPDGDMEIGIEFQSLCPSHSASPENGNDFPAWSAAGSGSFVAVTGVGQVLGYFESSPAVQMPYPFSLFGSGF